MTEARKQFSLAELIARLRPLEKDGLNAQSTVFNDLQDGSLIAEVRFPSYRDGRTAVPVEHWRALSFSDFRSDKDEEFYVSSADYAEAERLRLRQTTLAVCNGEITECDNEFLAFFQTRGWVRSDRSVADKHELIDFCFWAQHELTKLEVKEVDLQVWVRRDSLHGYVAEVEGRLSPPDPKELRAENWDGILKETIRRLRRDPKALEKGKVSKFCESLGQWAAEEYGVKHAPGIDRIRQVIDELKP